MGFYILVDRECVRRENTMLRTNRFVGTIIKQIPHTTMTLTLIFIFLIQLCSFLMFVYAEKDEGGGKGKKGEQFN